MDGFTEGFALLGREREVSVVRALQVAAFLAAGLLGLSVLALLTALVLIARPELFVGLGTTPDSRTALGMALLAGFGVLASAVIGGILSLLRGTLNDGM